MKQFVLDNKVFFQALAVWILSGLFLPASVAALVVVATAVFMYYKEQYEALFMGFFIILICSDSRLRYLNFAITAKEMYMGVLLFFFVKNFRSFRSANRLFILFLPFFLYSIGLVFFSDDQKVAAQKTLSYALLVLTIPSMLLYLYDERGVEFLKTLILILSVSLLTGIVFKMVGYNVTGEGRFRGIFGNPNGIGLFCMALFMLYFVVNKNYPDLFSRNEKIYFFIVLFLSLYWSKSRNSILTILILVFFDRFGARSPIISFIFVAAFTIGYEMLLQSFQVAVKSIGFGDYFRVDSLSSGSGRRIAWEFSWEHIQRNFYFGKGFGFDEKLFMDRETQFTLNVMGHQGNAHNSYLTFWLNTGLVGVLLFFRAFVLAFIKSAKQNPVALPVMFAILFSINFESWLMASLNPFTIVFFSTLTILASEQFNPQRKEAPVPLH